MTREQFVNYLQDQGLISPQAHSLICQAIPHAREPIGMIAVQHGLIRGDDIDKVLDAQRGSKLRFGELAVRMGLLREEQVDRLLEVQMFRAVSDLVEVLVLSGQLPFDLAAEHLSRFLNSECQAVLDPAPN
jgi:hypothetical protein